MTKTLDTNIVLKDTEHYTIFFKIKKDLLEENDWLIIFLEEFYKEYDKINNSDRSKFIDKLKAKCNKIMKLVRKNERN